MSEYCGSPLTEEYYKPHDLREIVISDPFMGGGTSLVEASRLGASVFGVDLNPMAYWVVQEELSSIEVGAYLEEAWRIRKTLIEELGDIYQTTCEECGNPNAFVKYFLWVKTINCEACSETVDLFPGYLVAKDQRHPKNVLVCPSCGNLNEVENRRAPGNCRKCGKELLFDGSAGRGKVTCGSCGRVNSYPSGQSVPRHRMFAIEYFCEECSSHHKGRYFKRPDSLDLKRYESAKERLKVADPSLVPDEAIQHGDESDRLLRWGYTHYRDLFNARQLLGLARIAELVSERNGRIRSALATNLSDLLRYQNMLCRYDTYALKSLDIFSIHGFPVGLIQCESNLFGISRSKRRFGASIGSGGWHNIVSKYAKAKEYCDRPFEPKFDDSGTIQKVRIPGERIGGSSTGKARSDKTSLFAADSRSIELGDAEFDGIFTDPPYLGNVQYAELMDFCYVWLRRLIAEEDGNFGPTSTRSGGELTSNTNMGRHIEDYADGLGDIFDHFAGVLKPGRPLVFTFHHKKPEAYAAVGVAILDSGLVCAASLPAPAEMGASIHIAGTASSILDTVFVCRRKGTIPTRWICSDPAQLAELMMHEVGELEKAGISLTRGDIRCLILGHVVRLAIWNLRQNWDKKATSSEKMEAVLQWMNTFGSVEEVQALLKVRAVDRRGGSQLSLFDAQEDYILSYDSEASFPG